MDESATQLGGDSSITPRDYTPGSDDLISRFQTVLEPEQESEAEADEAPDPAGQAEPEPEAEEPQPELFTVKIDGEEKAVTKDELIAHYQKERAAAKRFEEAAQLRKTVEAEQNTVRQEREQLRSALDQYTAQLQALMQSDQPDWQTLIKEDPQKYLELRHQWEQRAVNLQQAQAAQAHLQQQQIAEQQTQLREHLAQEQQRLFEVLPAWKDETVAKTESQAIRDYLGKLGFDNDRIQGIYDHREVLLVDKARKYDELMAKQAVAQKKVAPLPPRVEKPGVSEKSNDELRALKARLNRSGSPDDAAAIFKYMFDNPPS